MYALVDCNNFYVSCERVFHPKLLGKPVVVLSNNDGCAIARSKEAKELGIAMGAPAFKNAQFLRENGVIVFSSNYTLYADMSHRVMETLRRFTPDLQVYSIDEAFLKLDEKSCTASYMAEIKKTVLQWTGIPVSIGIAPTKTLAKAANHIAKNHPDGKGIFFLDRQDMVKTELKKLKVENIWGIGNQIKLFLNRHGIYTADEFCSADDAWIRKHLTVVALRTAMELRGISCLEFEEVPPSKKAIISSKSFGRPIKEWEELAEALSAYTARAAEKARRQGSLAGFLEVFVQTNPFSDAPYYGNKAHVVLPQPTAYTPELTLYAKQALRWIWKPGLPYKKTGVMLGGLVPKDSFQLDLFSAKPQDQKKQETLMRLIDEANKGQGKKALRFAAEGVQQPWKMKRSMCSPCFTTKWRDILFVNIS